MQIKQQALAQQVQKHIYPLYVLIGQDNYLLEDSLLIIKNELKKKYDYDEKLISISSTEDWNMMFEEANKYSLFSEATLLNVYFDKKNLDATGKKVLTQYLSSVNSSSFIILRAPNVPAKQLPWVASHQEALLVPAYSLGAEALKLWIVNQLKKYKLDFEPQIPELIWQYTEGNMLASAQTIEKISLTASPQQRLTAKEVLTHLSDQSEHTLFELTEACLMGKADKAIHILRQAATNKTEATLVLWMLTQEVRNLVQLSYALQNRQDFKTTCNQLKIWPQKTPLYQTCLKRLHITHLQSLLHYCFSIDELIKSHFQDQAWNALEQLSLGLSVGHSLGAS